MCTPLSPTPACSAMKNRSSLLAVLLGATLLAASARATPQDPSALRFSADGTFTLIQLTDLHYGESELTDERSDEVQATVLQSEEEEVGLVVFSGDMVTGFMWDLLGKPPGWTEARWQQLTAPVVAAGVPYAVTLGNHDREADLSAREVLALDMRTSNLSLTQQGPAGITGASNYYLDIYDASGEGVAARVWLLDSMDQGCGRLATGWGCVGADTAAWVAQQAAALPAVPSLAFIHIPLPQFMEVWDSQPTNGSKMEGVSCPAVDTGVFQVLRDAGIQAIYSGHNHNNDYVGVLDGVRLAFGRKSGYGNYGPPRAGSAAHA